MTDESPSASRIKWQNNTPCSIEFDDVYYDRQNGLEESRYVFLEHNQLVQRWSALVDAPGTCFTIGETGFGTGLNFLAAWTLWRQFGFRHARLHFVSAEKYPLDAGILERAHGGWPELASLSGQLCAALPLPYPGVHRRVFSNDRVWLTLLHDDAAHGFENVQARVDAWFLDGFSPKRNPDLWSPRVFNAMARLSHAGTTLATFSSASQVRHDLGLAGFALNKQPGHGYKREMCCGHFVGVASHPEIDRLPVQDAPWFRHELPAKAPESVIVIGAGLAGCAAAAALAARGLRVTVVDEASCIASAASGNPVGLTFVRLTTHASAQNRYYLQAYLHALGHLRRIFTEAEIPEGEAWSLNGILRVFDDEQDQVEMEAFLQSPGAEWLVQRQTQEQLSALAGFTIDKPGVMQPGSGWLNPATLCRALLAHPLIQVQLDTKVQSLDHGNERDSDNWNGNGWVLHTTSGQLKADAVVIANSQAAAQFEQTSHLSLRPVRGQITRLPPTNGSRNLRHAINYSGYLTPVWQGCHTVGATFHPKRTDTEETAADHAENIARLDAALPAFSARTENQANADWTGRVAFRTGTPDYLPYVGPAPVVDQYRRDYQDGLGKGQLKRLYPRGAVHPHLYVTAAHGSRGITSSLLAAEVLCHWMLEEPAPVDTETLQALHPARFLVRAFKRRQQQGEA